MVARDPDEVPRWTCLDLADDLLDLRLPRTLEQTRLSLQGVFHLVGQSPPRFSRTGAQVAQRADHLLSRSLGRLHGPDQLVVRVNPALILACSRADEHGYYIARIGTDNQE